MSVASQPIAVTRPVLDSVPVAYSSFSPRNPHCSSFQTRFYPGGSPGHHLGPIAMPDHDAWLKSDDDDPCGNYVCCGLPLADLHALVEHFESRHVELVAPITYDHDDSPDASPPAFDADDMDLSDPSPSPPATPAQSESAFDPVRVAMSACFRAPSSTAPYTSSYSSLAGANGSTPAPTPTPFNHYAAYADYSSALPGTHPSPAYHHLPSDSFPSSPPSLQSSIPPPPASIPPALLFSSASSSASPSPLTTPTSSRAPSPRRTPSSAASLILAKPFRCPKPGCNKSYKQQNGLKYHLSHGQCNFAPRDPAVDALSEAERERRLRPFVCAVGNPKECGRRYKNMNGLRYHYTHTGEHGARGLEMLAQGVHPLPDLGTSHSPQAQPQPQLQAQPHHPAQQQQQQQQHQTQHSHPTYAHAPLPLPHHPTLTLSQPHLPHTHSPFPVRAFDL